MIRLLLALLAGIANAFSFAPFEWWPLSILSLMVLFALWLRKDAMPFRQGLFFGLGQFGVGISWMYISIHDFGGMPPLVAGLCIFVLVLVLSLYPALVGKLQALFRHKKSSVRLLFLMPAIWLVVEWLRGWLLSGLPWLSTGYALLDTPAVHLAPLVGVYGVGLLATVTAGAITCFLSDDSKRHYVVVTLVALVWIGCWQSAQISWTQVDGDPVRIGIVQNNVPLLDKWNAQQSQEIIDDYLAQSRDMQQADIVVWPEAAVPAYLDELPRSFWQQIKSHPADFVFGSLYRKQEGEKWHAYNSLVAASDQVTLYSKQHLVPFGEFFPMPRLIQPLVDMLNIPMSDFSSWSVPQPALLAGGVRLAASICYEDAFPQVWQSQVPVSGLLINVSEDMWFGDSLAPHQRLQMARFRARETERPMIRASNNGLSALIDWRGEVLNIAPQFERATIEGNLQPRTGVTPYVEYGNRLILIIIALWGLIGVLFGGRRVSKINQF